MDIKLYQINLDKDVNDLAFLSMESVTARQNTAEIDSSIYEKVFDGSVPAVDLEAVYAYFNGDLPEDYPGRSLSVSDVVEVVKSDSVEPGFYYCDSIGFKQIPFDAAGIPEKKNDSIRVVMVEPGKRAKAAEIKTDLKSLQEAVGGFIETYYPFDEEVCIVCNDEGKIRGMEPCRAIYAESGEMMDIICGPFFICDCSTENFGSLSEEQLSKFTKQFRDPERFFKVGKDIIAIPYEAIEKTNRTRGGIDR